MKQCFLISVLIFFTFSSCKKEVVTSASAEFPNTVGNHWRYQYTVSGQPSSYIDVNIIGQATLPDGQNAKIWVYKILSYTDTAYVVSNGQTITFYNKPCLTCTVKMPFERMRYILPMQTGNIWFTNAPYGDTTKVLTLSTLTIPAGVFENTYELSKKRGNVTNSWTSNQIWFTPNVGLTKLIQGEFNLGPTIGNGLWELISYSLN